MCRSLVFCFKTTEKQQQKIHFLTFFSLIFRNFKETFTRYQTTAHFYIDKHIFFEISDYEILIDNLSQYGTKKNQLNISDTSETQSNSKFCESCGTELVKRNGYYCKNKCKIKKIIKFKAS